MCLSRPGPEVDGESRSSALVAGDAKVESEQLVAATPDRAAPLASIIRANPVVAHPDESLRMVVYRMAETGLTRFPVVERGTGRLAGMIALTDLLKARTLSLEAERRRERVLGARIAMPFRSSRTA